MVVVTFSLARSLCGGLDKLYQSLTPIVTKIIFLVAEIMLKLAVATSSVVKISFVVVYIFFKVAVITASVDKITFVVAEITFF